MAFIPPRPFGDTPEARGLQAIWDILWGPDSIFTDTLAIQFQKQATGKYIPKINLPMAKGAVAGMVFRGEFDPTKTDYVVQNVVFIRAGSNAGAFICVKDAPDATHPPTNPDTGNEFWMAWPGSFPLGQWM